MLENKVCNFCVECGFNYSIDIQYCPKCHEKLFPIPYLNLDGFNKNKRKQVLEPI